MSVLLTIVESNCRSGHCLKGDSFLVEDLCPPICHELWSSAYPYVFALLNGGSLDHGPDKARQFDVRCPDGGRVWLHGEAVDEPPKGVPMEQKSLMETNVYSVRGTVLVCGACLRETHPAAWQALAEQADGVYALCLENTHINMAITKISAILGTGQVEKILFASVDRSPHCTQMHYIRHEIERVLPRHVPMESYVAAGERVVPVPEEAVELSRSLARLSEIVCREEPK